MNTHIINPANKPDQILPDEVSYQFDSLQPGKGFIIHDDNDPHSIYSQMLKEKGDSFSWEYLEVGPKKWTVKISKKDPDHCGETIGEMAVADHRKALVLRKYGLDYSFKGKLTIKQACEEREISTKNVTRELSASGKHSLMYTINYSNWEIEYLVDFIITNHHQYTRKTLAQVTEIFRKNSNHIAQNHPAVLPVLDLFIQLKDAMMVIMNEEEQVLFPQVRFLSQAAKGNIAANLLPAGSVKHPIKRIESAHQRIGELLLQLNELTSNYTSPAIHSSFYNEILQALNAFDNDVHQHVHVENNILFKKAILLEEQCAAKVGSGNAGPGKSHTASDHLSSLL